MSDPCRICGIEMSGRNKRYRYCSEQCRIERDARRREFRRRDYAANPDYFRESSRRYRAANLDAVRERERQIYAANPHAGHPCRVCGIKMSGMMQFCSEHCRNDWCTKKREQRRHYYNANRDARREYTKAWRKNNYDQQIAYRKKYYAANRGTQIERSRLYYAVNRERCQQDARQRFAANRESRNEYSRQRRAERSAALQALRELGIDATFKTAAAALKELNLLEGLQ